MANSLKDKLAANAAIKGNGLDALLGNNPMDAMRVDDRRVQDIALNKLHPFEGHTFLVVKNSDYDSMVDSIRNSGVTVPLIVRPHPTIAGDFEIIAGHRRFSASTDAGLREVLIFAFSLFRCHSHPPLVLWVYGGYQNGNSHFRTIKRCDCLVDGQNDHQPESARYS